MNIRTGDGRADRPHLRAAAGPFKRTPVSARSTGRRASVGNWTGLFRLAWLVAFGAGRNCFHRSAGCGQDREGPLPGGGQTGMGVRGRPTNR